MSSVHNPVEKKHLSYERDHYAKGKSDKGSRQSWPGKKRKANRAFRHASDVITRTAVQRSEPEADFGFIKKTKLQKWTVPKLRERVLAKLGKRLRSAGAKQGRKRTRNPTTDTVSGPKRVWKTIKSLPFLPTEALQEMKYYVIDIVRKRKQGIICSDECYGNLTPKQFAPVVRETLKAIERITKERMSRQKRAESVVPCL